MKKFTDALICWGLYMAMCVLAYCIAAWGNTQPKAMPYTAFGVAFALGQIIISIAPRSMFGAFLLSMVPFCFFAAKEKDRITGTVQEH
jgi:hypothetical protein